MSALSRASKLSKAVCESGRYLRGTGMQVGASQLASSGAVATGEVTNVETGDSLALFKLGLGAREQRSRPSQVPIAEFECRNYQGHPSPGPHPYAIRMQWRRAGKYKQSPSQCSAPHVNSQVQYM